MKISLLLLLPFAAASASQLRNSDNDNAGSCAVAHSESDCNAAKSDDDSPCVWCECSAIPSECLTLEQSQSVPPGVFNCKTPGASNPDIADSTVLQRMTIQDQPVDDDFCDANSLSGYVAVDESQYDQDGENKHLFYWMFQKRNSDITDQTIPLVVWLTGGPGCSSSL